MGNKRLWWLFISVLVVSFSVLGFCGHQIYREAPPIPASVIGPDGEVLFTGKDIRDGQNVWQSTGGQELGSVWGHGAYVAPDWTADWLHRELVFILNGWSRHDFQKAFDELDEEKRATLTTRLEKQIRANEYDPATDTLTLPKSRVDAFRHNSGYYTDLFMGGASRAREREAYAMKEVTVKDGERMRQLNAFFFWATWACSTPRPGQDITYTNNWPHEKLIGNTPPKSLMLWSGFSVIILLAGIALLSLHHAANGNGSTDGSGISEKDPLLQSSPSPSMKATLKYFWVVMALMIVQVGLGVVTAHYGVEGQTFYGLALSDWLPYSLSRTWHVQIGIFWIATSWLATGLFIAPAVSGHEPRHQVLGVNVLLVALVVVVVGSLTGEALGIGQKLDLPSNFWLGHQGYEYVDLGRFWQILLLAGLVLWLVLVVAAIRPALRRRDESYHLLVLFVIASAAIALLYAAGLMWGQHTHLAIAEYWRWWVVHLWVEGFFEVFATVVIAFLFARLKLMDMKLATSAALFSTIIFLAGGIVGTLHHLYFGGTPTSAVALGATFSALEVVPLVLIGFEAHHNLRLSRAADWVKAYKWPIWYFIAVAFWNFLGAGIFGFLINPPIALYYMQGLNTTAVHGHTALFGVYGMLGIGLILFALRRLTMGKEWKDRPMKIAFWSINIGLLLMVLLSLLPLGFLQTMASMEHGLWYARSMEFLQGDALEKIRWMRAIGDTIFAVGVLILGWFVVGLKTGWSFTKTPTREA